MVQGAGSRNKGHNGERQIANMLTRELGRDVNRNVDQVRDGGADIIDVRPFAIEVKRCEQLNLTGWWKQALRQRTKKNPVAVLIWRRNNERWSVRIESRVLVKKKFWRKGYDDWVQIDVEHFIDVVKSGALRG